MQKTLSAILVLFSVGYNLFFGNSVNAVAFIGSAMPHERFIEGCRALSTIRLTKFQMHAALESPIILGGRQWSIDATRGDDREEMRRILADESAEIHYTCEGREPQLATDTFEIDSQGMLRRPVQVLAKGGGIDEDGLYEQQLSVLFVTPLTDTEKANPLLLSLLSFYQYSMTFDQRSKIKEAADPEIKRRFTEDSRKSVTVVSRLINNPLDRAHYIQSIEEMLSE